MQVSRNSSIGVNKHFVHKTRCFEGESNYNSSIKYMHQHEYESIIYLAKDTLLAVVIELAIIASRCEFLYSSVETSGRFNIQITAFFVLFGLAICGFREARFDKYDIAKVITICFIGLWAYDLGSLRYALVLSIILFWNKIVLINLNRLCRIMIILGIIGSLFTGTVGITGRFSGFLVNSPPMFALTMTICVTYLTFYMPNELPSTFDTVFIILGIILIALSQTRVFIAASIVIVAYGYLRMMIEKVIPNKRHRRTVFAIASIVLLLLVLINFSTISSILARDDGEYSTMTRAYMASMAFQAFSESPIAIVLGHGGGYITTMLKIATGQSSYIPLHQDILMYLVDYGLVGTLAVCFAFFGKIRWHWYMWLVFILSTFHNIMSSGISFLILFLCFQSLMNREMMCRENGLCQ